MSFVSIFQNQGKHFMSFVSILEKNDYVTKNIHCHSITQILQHSVHSQAKSDSIK